jgi:hypothetical protein
MKLFRSIVFLTATLVACQAGAKVSHVGSVHLKAVDATRMLHMKGINVPKIYVVDQAGALQFETSSDPDAGDKRLFAALESSQIKPGPRHMVMDILSAGGVHISGEKSLVLVSIEAGKSMGVCPPCTVYYPEIEATIAKSKKPVRWIRVFIETNTYVPTAAKAKH